MDEPEAIEQQVRANLPKFEALPDSDGDRLWLTFYLCASSEQLRCVADDLGKAGWTNLGGWEGSFIYPKVQVEKAVAQIVETALAAQQVCAEHGAEILNIDADTNPEMGSRFVTLYRSSS